MSEADKRQEGGSHYRTDFWQTWNLIIPMGWSTFQFEIINYVDRYQRKGGIEDLRKARHWLDKLIEVEEAKLAPKEEFKLSEGDAGPRISFEGVADGYAVCEGDIYRVTLHDGNVVMRNLNPQQSFDLQLERKVSEKILDKVEQETVLKRRAVEDEKGAIATVKAQMAARPVPLQYSGLTAEEG